MLLVKSNKYIFLSDHTTFFSLLTKKPHVIVILTVEGVDIFNTVSYIFIHLRSFGKPYTYMYCILQIYYINLVFLVTRVTQVRYWYELRRRLSQEPIGQSFYPI